MDILRYGVFALGKIWTLTDETGSRLGFRSRELAITALQTVIAVHRSAVDCVLVTLQDKDGRLRTLLNPLEDLNIDPVANDAEWDALLGLKPVRSMIVQPAGAGVNDA